MLAEPILLTLYLPKRLDDKITRLMAERHRSRQQTIVYYLKLGMRVTEDAQVVK